MKSLPLNLDVKKSAKTTLPMEVVKDEKILDSYEIFLPLKLDVTGEESCLEFLPIKLDIKNEDI